MSDPQNTPSVPERSPGPSRRQGNDSLWKRARRTLGTHQLTFLQPQSKSSPEKNPKPADGKPAPNKRREQVRTAQRTHRQRTQSYIKTLEQEVLRLRASESKLTQNQDHLQGQVDILRATLILHHIPLPAGVESSTIGNDGMLSSPGSGAQATVSYMTDDFDHQRLHIDWPSITPEEMQAPTTYPYQATQSSIESRGAPSQGGIFKPLPSRPRGIDTRDFNLHGLTRSDSNFEVDETSHITEQPPQVQSQQRSRPQTLDTQQNAVDFVLALEHPCMQHLSTVYEQQTSVDEPSNHILTASLPLATPLPAAPQLNTSWTVPAASIEALLSISASLNLEGEITPAQAWMRVREHPGFGQLRQEGLDRLKRELSWEVTCEGFGAVLDEVVFWMKLESILGPTQYHQQS
ncbi:hypothetical protein MMC24_005508 [Lignoscripta atroalba]|nr:hypothetical protein [Lignoscripta atroalba]